MRENLPKEVSGPLIQKACELIDPVQIVLFGSFARGDQREKSDIDLAFRFKGSQENWVKYKSWVEDQAQTLREFDLVDMDEADSSILEAIEREGIVLYER